MVLSLTIEQLPLCSDQDGVFRVGNTRVTLDTVVAVFNQGATAEEIAQQYSTLDLADAYAVISYYLKHTEEVEAYLQQRSQVATETRCQNEARYKSHGIRERLLARRTLQKNG